MTRPTLLLTVLAAGAAACGGDSPTPHGAAAGPAGPVVAVTDSVIDAVYEAAGPAEPLQAATLATKLMATVTAVTVHEGDRVRAGQVLVRLDARDLAAKRQQVEASLAEAAALRANAEVTARRLRALYADSAAPKATLDAAETGLARAQAGEAAARAAAAELDATASYSELRAPFAGVVTQRLADAGAFATPGMPLVTVEDPSRLRIGATVPAALAHGLAPGRRVRARVEGMEVDAVIEGVAPQAGGLYLVNALVPNRDGRLPSRGAAVLHLPTGTRRALLVPEAALVQQGDLVGVWRRTAAGPALTWVRPGEARQGMVEVLSGVAAGDSVVVPAAGRGA